MCEIRLAGQKKMGYYPTPDIVVRMIKPMLEFPHQFAALDPCCGKGKALADLLQGTGGKGYGIELDLGRAKNAEQVLYKVAKGALELSKIPSNVFSLLFLNPPYDYETTRSYEGTKRKEYTFLRNTTNTLIPGGILVYIIPQVRISPNTTRYLDYSYENIRAWRMPSEEYKAFGQIVVIGRKKRLKNTSDASTKRLMAELLNTTEELPRKPTTKWQVPESGIEVEIVGGQIYEEEAKNTVSLSPATKRFGAYLREIVPEPERVKGRSPTFLHKGHIGLLLAAGHLSGIVGSGEDTHVVRGICEKVEQEIETCKEGETRTLETHRVRISVMTPDGAIRVL